MKTDVSYYRMDKTKIALFRFILEAYEGVGVLTTIDNHKGLVRVHIPDGFKPVFENIVKDVEANFKLSPCSIENESL